MVRPRVFPQISFIPEKVGSYNLEIQAVDNRVAFSKILSISFKLGRVWYLNPLIAIPFWEYNFFNRFFICNLY